MPCPCSPQALDVLSHQGAAAAASSHQALTTLPHRVPPPFASFAVRSDEVLHAWQARAPYAWVHHMATRFLQPAALRRLAAHGLAQVQIAEAGDVDYAPTSLAELAVLANQPAPPDRAVRADRPKQSGISASSPWVAPAHDAHSLASALAAALQATGVLGPALAGYARAVAHRIDFLASRGAGFHNDVTGPWSRSLFWVLALDLAEVEFVLPHAGLRLPLAPGDLLVFDPCMAHGLCRPQDRGQMRAGAFEGDTHAQQIFLTGELRLDDAQWAALGAPWLPIAHHAQRRALDLLVAEFDACSGHIKSQRALRNSMQPEVCHATWPVAPGPGPRPAGS